VSISIRRASTADFEQIWAIFQPIVKAGETYAFDPDTTREQAFRLWMEAPLQTFVAELNGQIVGTYYIKPNQPALGAHVCNCGYMVAGSARGQGVATLMCEHSQAVALKLGFKAMQFNLVVVTNKGAIRLWQRLGFEIVGRLPGAFRHRSIGLVDAFVFYKWLDPVLPGEATPEQPAAEAGP
jgi:L-amino acid N-acyltransferase YncA